MKAMINKKFNIFSSSYEKMDKSRKKMVLYAIFTGLSIILTETLLLESVDKFNEARTKIEESQGKKDTLIKEKGEVLLKNAHKTEKSLSRQKEILLKEIDEILKNKAMCNLRLEMQVLKMV